MGNTKPRTDRALVFVVDFEISDNLHLYGYVIAPPSDVAGTIGRALDEIEPLATVAGLQATQNLLPGMVNSAFFFDGEEWRLGWWTDGERVIRTASFDEHQPDCQQVLGRPLLSSSLEEAPASQHQPEH